MKRTFGLLCCLVLLIVFSASAMADAYCWYEYQNGVHDYEQVDERKATCTEDGYYLLECRQCGKNIREITGKATGHEWQKVDNEFYPPTCTQDGLTTYVCGDCSQIRTESVRATGHDMRDEAVVRSPTCEIEGRMAIRCSRCGYSDVRDIPRADHQYGAWRVTVPATDHSIGTRQSVCAECGDARYENFYPDGTLRRGAKDDAVRALQQKLLDLGILQDKADGIFGAKTESAVKAYQTGAGLYPDGVAWPQTLSQLSLDWQAAARRAPAETPAPALPSAPVAVCETVLDENGAEHVRYCDYHRSMAEIAASIESAADETRVLRARNQIRALWQAELESLWSEWLQAFPEAEQGAALAAQTAFTSYLAAQETVLRSQCGDADAAWKINAILERQCTMLCQMLREGQA